MSDKKISQLTAASTPLAGTEVLPIVQSGSTVKATVANVQEAPVASGTANGVVFLNASKVPATGSALTFNGTETSSTGAFRTSDEFSSLGGRLALYRSAGASYIDWASAQNLNWRTVTSVGGGGATTLMTLGSTGDLTVSAGNLVVGTAAKGIDFSANTGAAGEINSLLNWYETGTWTPTLTCTDGNFTSVTYDPLRGGRYTRIGNMVHVQCYMRTDAVDNTVGRSGDVLIAGLPFSAVTATSGTLDGHSSLAVSVASSWAGEEPLAAFISGGDNNIQLLYRSAVDGGTSNVVAADVGTGANANIVLIAGTYICA
jgi:hypothetical protein